MPTLRRHRSAEVSRPGIGKAANALGGYNETVT